MLATDSNGSFTPSDRKLRAKDEAAGMASCRFPIPRPDDVASLIKPRAVEQKKPIGGPNSQGDLSAD